MELLMHLSAFPDLAEAGKWMDPTGQFYMCCVKGCSESETTQNNWYQQSHFLLESVAMGMFRFLEEVFNESIPSAHAKFHSNHRITSWQLQGHSCTV